MSLNSLLGTVAYWAVGNQIGRIITASAAFLSAAFCLRKCYKKTKIKSEDSSEIDFSLSDEDLKSAECKSGWAKREEHRKSESQTVSRQ